MKSEDLKKQFLSSREIFSAKRWEGKPLPFKLKFALANYPEYLVAAVMLFFVLPPIAYYNYWSFPGSKRDALKKFKSHYVVVRPNHPEIEEILKEKEVGREYFPRN